MSATIPAPARQDAAGAAGASGCTSAARVLVLPIPESAPLRSGSRSMRAARVVPPGTRACRRGPSGWNARMLLLNQEITPRHDLHLGGHGEHGDGDGAVRGSWVSAAPK